MRHRWTDSKNLVPALPFELDIMNIVMSGDAFYRKMRECLPLLDMCDACWLLMCDSFVVAAGRQRFVCRIEDNVLGILRGGEWVERKGLDLAALVWYTY